MPRRTPRSAAATVDAVMYATTVVAHFEFRLRSPSGVMLASIETPQGDHEDRSPATIALAMARATNALM